MSVRRLTSTNPNTLDEHSIALRAQRFPAWRPRCVWLGNPDKNDFGERYDLMSVVFTIGLFVCRSFRCPSALISTDFVSSVRRSNPRSDLFVSAKSFTIAKAHLAIRANRPSLFFDSLDSALSRI